MTQLVLLVVAAAWLAVLIPPMLRSRVQNRPNSSVTDFRDQLTKLQSTTTPTRSAVRGIGRPLTQSPLSRPVATGRLPQPVLRSGVTRRPTRSELAAQAAEAAAPSSAGFVDAGGDSSRFRSHGDPTGGQRRPSTQERPMRAERHPRREAAPRRDNAHRGEMSPRDDHGRRAHGDPSGGSRRPADATGEVKRRRSNILFALVLTTACSLFLAATSSSDVLLYIFVVSFLALCAYVYLLAQQNGQVQPLMRDARSDLR